MTPIPFEALPVSQELKRAARELGFENATEIQSRAIPVILEGRDLVGRSQTGTGKTAAFAVPAVELTDGENKEDIQVLVVSPTRELALQTWDVFKKLYKYKSGVKSAVIYGGQPIDRQIRELKRGVNIVIGTPGRIMDHLRRRTLKLGNLRMIVLDEADEMLNMGFREDMENILSSTPATRQTLFFCATMPPEIMAITDTYLKNPERIEINKEEVAVSAIEQYYCTAPSEGKQEALTLLLRKVSPRRAIVFCNTQRMVDEVCRYLGRSGFKATGIHGRIQQDVRTQVMQNFKSGGIPILVATDVAARGIDARNVDTVINFDIPMTAEDYIHRIGRTGRAGKGGRAYTFAAGEAQMLQLEDYMRQTKSYMAYFELPGMERPLRPQRAAHVRPATKLPTPDKKPRPERRSAAAVRSEAPASGGESTKIVLNIGKNQHIAPNHIVAAIAEKTSLSGHDIGKITVLPDESVVEIPVSHRREVLDALQGSTIKGVRVEGHGHEERALAERKPVRMSKSRRPRR